MILPLIDDIIHFDKKHYKKNKSIHNDGIKRKLEEIRQSILTQGDHALRRYTEQFDSVTIHNFLVDKETIKSASKRLPSKKIEAIKQAIANIEAYHQFQKPKNWHHEESGVGYGVKYIPIDSVGLYIPGGETPYYSSVMMSAIPAKIANVPHIYIATPPGKDGKVSDSILCTAHLCGIDTIYTIGGAQAIFALAYGTSSIKAVDKIVGPGNIYVDLAKQMVYGHIDIDKPAGPSDVLVYVDEIKFLSFAASEILAQLEHDPMAIALCIVSNEAYIPILNQFIEIQLQKLSRKAIILKSLLNSGVFVAKTETEVCKAINIISPEHLVLLSNRDQNLLDHIKHAGSVFCGPYTPVTLGDYFAGPNHVLPTSGAARFSSPLGVMDFVKYTSYLKYSKDKLKSSQATLYELTELEGFDAHYNAVHQRFSDDIF